MKIKGLGQDERFRKLGFHDSPQGAGATIPDNVSPQGARSNGNWLTLIYKCTAGKCRKLTIKGVEYYVCPIPKVFFLLMLLSSFLLKCFSKSSYDYGQLLCFFIYKIF